MPDSNGRLIVAVPAVPESTASTPACLTPAQYRKRFMALRQALEQSRLELAVPPATWKTARGPNPN